MTTGRILGWLYVILLWSFLLWSANTPHNTEKYERVVLECCTSPEGCELPYEPPSDPRQ